jgi:hypothetical protein
VTRPRAWGHEVAATAIARRSASHAQSDPDEIAHPDAAGASPRELHDSVTQALFAIALHARAAQLALARAGIDAEGPAAWNMRQVQELAQRALTDLRANGDLPLAAPGDEARQEA